MMLKDNPISRRYYLTLTVFYYKKENKNFIKESLKHP